MRCREHRSTDSSMSSTYACRQHDGRTYFWKESVGGHHYLLNHSFSALQLAEYPYGDGIEVIFSGGRGKFMPRHQKDPEYPYKKGERLDGRDLIQEWVGKHPNSKYVWNKSGFDQIDVKNVDHVIGKQWFLLKRSQDVEQIFLLPDYVGLSHDFYVSGHRFYRYIFLSRSNP